MSSAAEREAVPGERATADGRPAVVVNGARPAAPPPAVPARPGPPVPLGARFRTGPDQVAGTDFALWAGGAEAVELCLFDGPGPGARESRVRLTELTHGIWHGFVPGVRPGQRYGYRVHGRWDPWTGARWNPAKLLLDPYARAVDGDFGLPPEVYGHVRDWPEQRVADTVRDDRDSAPYVPKGVVVHDDDDRSDDRRPRRRGRTRSSTNCTCAASPSSTPASPPELRGTYAGLAQPAAIEHLTRLGVTAVELLPVHQFAHENHLLRRPAQPLGLQLRRLLRPARRLRRHRNGRAEVGEFKRMVRALHAAGIEVVLDVVYNHTAEAERTGPDPLPEGHRQPRPLPPPAQRPPVRRLHRLRQHPARRPAARAARHAARARMPSRPKPPLPARAARTRGSKPPPSSRMSSRTPSPDVGERDADPGGRGVPGPDGQGLLAVLSGVARPPRPGARRGRSRCRPGRRCARPFP
ncbi:Glycogen debranching enzyme [Streptomyces violaceorubidus]